MRTSLGQNFDASGRDGKNPETVKENDSGVQCVSCILVMLKALSEFILWQAAATAKCRVFGFRLACKFISMLK